MTQAVQIVHADGKCVDLERVAYSETLFEEGWLQELIHAHPDLLPVGEIDPAYAGLAAIGTEIPVAAGSVDNLFLTRTARLVVAECKLWRNPEQRREVVSQILEYAEALAEMDYEDLQAAWEGKRSEDQPKTLFGLAQGIGWTGTETEFVDSLTATLRHGRFMLTIVGDGIRESSRRLAQFLSKSRRLEYTLALIELACYRLGDEPYPLVVVPQVVLQSEVVQRIVVEARAHGVDVSVSVEGGEAGTAEGRGAVISPEEFYDWLSEEASAEEVQFARELFEEMTKDSRVSPQWRTAGYTILALDPEDGVPRFTLFVVQRTTKVWFGWLPGQLQRAGYDPQLALSFYRRVAGLNDKFELCQDPNNVASASVETPRLKDLLQRREEFLAAVAAFLDGLEKRPRPLGS